MSLILKIAVLAVACAVFSSLLRESRPEYVLPLQLCFALIIVSFLISAASKRLGGLFDDAFSDILEKSYISVLLKGAFVSAACTVCASLCRESGNKALADTVELAGRIMIILFCVPLIESVVETALMYIK